MPSAVESSVIASASHEAHYLTLAEACEVLRVSKPTLVSAIKRGEVEARRVGRQWRIPLDALEPKESGGQ